MSAVMDDATLVKASLKKQRDMQDELIARLERYQAPVDTTELKRLVAEFKTALNSAASLKPRIDTSTIDQTIKQAVTSAISTVSLSNLTDEVKTQARAIERNNSLLSNGEGWQLKFWVIMLTLAFGFMAGCGVNWYFEVPAKIAGVSKYQTLQSWYDGINEMMKDNCQLAKAYYKARNLNPKDVQCGTLPLKTSQQLISGN
jgi:hypothetical protein